LQSSLQSEFGGNVLFVRSICCIGTVGASRWEGQVGAARSIRLRQGREPFCAASPAWLLPLHGLPGVEKRAEGLAPH